MAKSPSMVARLSFHRCTYYIYHTSQGTHLLILKHWWEGIARTPVSEDFIQEHFTLPWCQAYLGWIDRCNKAIVANESHMGHGWEVFPDVEEGLMWEFFWQYGFLCSMESNWQG